MTYSMTGFASVHAESELGRLAIELKTVNSRYLDIYFKMPESVKSFENDFRQLLGKYLTRGKIECTIRFYAATDEQLTINHQYVSALLSASTDLATTHAIENVGVGELLRLPGVLVDKPTDAHALKAWILPQFEQAINELIAQRKNEGTHLNMLLSERLDAVDAIVAEVSDNYTASIEKIQDKLHEKLTEVAERFQNHVDEMRFEQEMIYLLQKMDVAEEIDRLVGHSKEIRKLLVSDKPKGRKLDFLMQEMNRESNTIGSKSQSLGLTMNAVDLKVLLEQMREQIQNIE